MDFPIKYTFTNKQYPAIAELIMKMHHKGTLEFAKPSIAPKIESIMVEMMFTPKIHKQDMAYLPIPDSIINLPAKKYLKNVRGLCLFANIHKNAVLKVIYPISSKITIPNKIKALVPFWCVNKMNNTSNIIANMEIKLEMTQKSPVIPFARTLTPNIEGSRPFSLILRIEVIIYPKTMQEIVVTDKKTKTNSAGLKLA